MSTARPQRCHSYTSEIKAAVAHAEPSGHPPDELAVGLQPIKGAGELLPLRQLKPLARHNLCPNLRGCRHVRARSAEARARVKSQFQFQGMHTVMHSTVHMLPPCRQPRLRCLLVALTNDTQMCSSTTQVAVLETSASWCHGQVRQPLPSSPPGRRTSRCPSMAAARSAAPTARRQRRSCGTTEAEAEAEPGFQKLRV